jgi:hypothetical protein
MVNILYEFGFNFWKCDKHDRNAWKKIEKLQENEFTKLLIYRIRRIRSRPMNLKQLCRIRLLDIFEDKYLASVPKLNIPGVLISYLQYNDVK